MAEAVGMFEVALNPAPGHEPGQAVDALVLEKTYSGDLIATARGQMLAHRSATDGSAGYVAMEQVNGTLEGREGSFVLQHEGRMDRGEPYLSVKVVPDSGTADLTGLKGEMSITVHDNGDHHYILSFELP